MQIPIAEIDRMAKQGSTKPGTFQPGNQMSKRRPLWRLHLTALIEREYAELPSPRQRIVMAANKVLDLAAQGERWACEMLRDTFDGRPTQPLDVALEMRLSELGCLARSKLASTIQTTIDQDEPES